MRPTSFGLVLVVALSGCARSTLVTSDAGTDAGLAADAGSIADAGSPSDADPRRDAEAPLDAGPVDLRLGTALTCAMDADIALSAIVRFVACRTDDRATVAGLMEAWEAGLLSALEPTGGLVEGLDGNLGCAGWRCLASAATCEDAASCTAPTGPACEPFANGCDGDVITTCVPDGAGARRGFDCATVGATCIDGRCALGDCVFGNDYYQLECNGDALTLCDGLVALPCAAWAPGSRCTSFAIGGEVPTQWCSPTGDGVAGAYARPVECAGGVLSFESVSLRTYTFDCLAAGYSGCGDPGCSR